MKPRTWHDVVNELTTDPATGTRIYGSLAKIVKATGIPRSTLDATLRDKTPPRGGIEVVRKIAVALEVPPMRLFCPDDEPGSDRQAEAVSDVFYQLAPEERATIMRALSDRDAVKYVLGALSVYERVRTQASTLVGLTPPPAPKRKRSK